MLLASSPREIPKSNGVLLLRTLTVVDWEGEFHALLDSVDTERVCELFSDRVFEALLKAELLDEETVNNMKSWSHSGFSVYVSEEVEPESSDSLHFLARYLKRSPISLERLSVEEQVGKEPVVKYKGWST